MPSTNKLRPHRRSQYKGTRRRKPRVRDLIRLVREQVAREHELVQLLHADAEFRRTQLQTAVMDLDPLAVWTDFDHLRDYTNLGPEHLLEWEQIGEYLKLHVLFRVALLYGAYSFTAKVRPDLEAKWIREGRSPMDRIQRLVAKQIGKQSLNGLEFCYVVEGRSRSGKSRTGLHLHGFFVADDPIIATGFKQVMEKAIAMHPKGRKAAGISPKAGPEVVIERAYDSGHPDEGTSGRWATYIAKNATKWDARLGKKPIYMSQTATQLAREFWAFLREEPVV